MISKEIQISDNSDASKIQVKNQTWKDARILPNTLSRCATIDIFRMVFCVLVFLRHSAYLGYSTIWGKGGYLGVEFFFLVSGYLMTRSVNK